MRQFDISFTSKLRRWLDDENREYSEGAMLLFRLRGNQIEFRKLSANPDAYRKYIFDNIKKFYDFRVAEIPHEKVVEKVGKARKAAEDVDKGSPNEGNRSGKRPDHDELPEDIKSLFEQNKSLILRIADLHRKMRLIINSKAECKDADLLPFADEIIRLDKRRLANWKKYDNFSAVGS